MPGIGGLSRLPATGLPRTTLQHRIWAQILKISVPSSSSACFLNTYGYGSIPIHTIFRGLFTSINPSYFDVNYRGTIGFDPLPYLNMWLASQESQALDNPWMIRVSHPRAKSWTLSTSMDDLVDEGVQDAETIYGRGKWSSNRVMFVLGKDYIYIHYVYIYYVYIICIYIYCM